MMSFDNLLNRQLAAIRSKLIRELTELCQLSSTGSAIGFQPRVRTSTYVQCEVIARLTADDLYVDFQFGDKNSFLISSIPVDRLMKIRKLKWICSRPYHPLEALAEASEDN